jgi:hypothetical protein
MRAVSIYATAVVTAAMLAPASGAYAQNSQLSVPNVEVTAPPFVGTRSPYFGRYRVEEDKFGEAPCSQTRIALGPSGKCLQGYRLTVPENTGYRGSSPCDMALDVVIDTTGNLSVEADILVFDPYAVYASGGSPPKFCWVRSYLGYDQTDFQDMNQVTRRGTNWHNLQINDAQNQWYVGQRSRSMEFSYGPHNCIAVRKPGPVWRGGYVYMMHASICRTDTAAVQAQDVDYVLGSLQTRIYDPVGNLRKADDQTTYTGAFGPAANTR